MAIIFTQSWQTVLYDMSNKNTVRGIIIIINVAMPHRGPVKAYVLLGWPHFSSVFAYFGTFQSGQNTGAIHFIQGS